jgi:hypothetical protein
VKGERRMEKGGWNWRKEKETGRQETGDRRKEKGERRREKGTGEGRKEDGERRMEKREDGKGGAVKLVIIKKGRQLLALPLNIS